MALSNPIQVAGICSVLLEDRTNGDRHMLRVLGDVNFENTQETTKNYGGCQKFPWASLAGQSTATVTMTLKEYPLSALKYLSPYTSSAVDENTSGDVAGYAGYDGVSGALGNVVGTSVFNATTGIASVAVTAASNPIFGDYLIKAAGATTANIYIDNQLDGLSIVDDTLKVNSSAYTIPGTGGTVDFTEIKVTATGGSGAIAMVTSDIARIQTRPINSYNYTYKIGASGSSLPEFSMAVFSEKLASDQYRALYFPKVKSSGFNINFVENDFSTTEVTLDVLFDSVAGYAAKWVVIGR